MDDFERMKDVRKRFVRHHWALQTWAERRADMDRHQEETWNAMLRSPAGFKHFLRRNFKARAVATVETRVE